MLKKQLFKDVRGGLKEFLFIKLEQPRGVYERQEIGYEIISRGSFRPDNFSENQNQKKQGVEF